MNVIKQIKKQKGISKDELAERIVLSIPSIESLQCVDYLQGYEKTFYEETITIPTETYLELLAIKEKLSNLLDDLDVLIEKLKK